MNRENDTILYAMAVLGTSLLLTTGMMIKDRINKNKINDAKKILNGEIVESLYEKGFGVASVNTECFDYMSGNETYLFKFTGSATNLNNEKIDFFSAVYKVNEQQYYETLELMKKNNINDINSAKLLRMLSKIVKDSELVESNLNEQIAVRGIEDASKFEKVGKNIILDVTNPIVSDKKVSYKVYYAQEVKTKDGELGLVKSLVNVEFDKTEELAQNPLKVFAKEKESATIKILNRDFDRIQKNEVFTFSAKEMNKII
ncbi:MAG: hypothetical protein ACI4R8_04270 [Candidatus Caccovivens sp.]